MSAESSQPSESSKDPVIIVYHTENRIFARLFNERSLEEVKDVVRRKLGLGKETGISLKQMGHDALLDLEDDDDFQAFRVFVKSSVSVDVAVTIGKFQGPAVPPLPRENTLEDNQTTITSVSPSRELALAASPPNPLPQSIEPSSAPAEASHKRKRKVSFDDASSTAVSHLTPKKHPTELTAPSKTVKQPAAKRQKKEVTKKKDSKQSEATEDPQASSASKPAAKKSITLEGASEATTSTSKDAETSQSAVKKQRKSKKSSALVETITPDQTNNAIDDVPALQLASAQPGTSGAVGSTSKPRKLKVLPEEVHTNIDIPGMSESIGVPEVTAAILSEARSIKKITKKTTASRKPAKSAAVMNVAHLELILPPCPICLGVPFHLRYFCPVFLKGPDAIRARLEEVKGTDESKKEWLVREMEGALRESQAMFVSSLDIPRTNNVQMTEVPPPPDSAPVSRTPSIPPDSCLSQVIVGSRNEGSSSESSDAVSNRGVEPKELLSSKKPPTVGEKPSLVDDDLDTVIRGPVRKRQSILSDLDHIIGDKEEVSDSEEDEAELEEDPDEESGRSKHPLSKLVTHSSDSESEEEMTESPSSPRPSKGDSDNPGPAVQAFSEPIGESSKQLDGDVVMKVSVGALNVEGQDGDSSKQARLGPHDQMVVDESDGEMGFPKQPSSVPRDSVLQPVDARSDEPQEPGETDADPTSDGAGGISGVIEALTEMDTDPIEPVDDLEAPAISRLPDVDPIEMPSEDSGAFFPGATQSMPQARVTKRIKTRNGQIPDDEAEGPVLLEQLSTEVTPLPTMGMTEGSETPTCQEPATSEKSPRLRLSPLPSSTRTPAAVAWMNHRAKGTRTIKASKTPARRSGTQHDALQSGAKGAQTPSAIRWATLAEPLSSPFVQREEPILLDELTSSSPLYEDNPIYGQRQVEGENGLPRTPMVSREPEKERLFDLSSSQIPFPYSQYQTPAPTELLNGKERVDVTDSEEEEEVTKAKTKPTVRVTYRSLSQLASQATLFSPSLPTPATSKSMTNGKAKKHALEEESSSSSSSGTDEANGSEHIPRERMAGSVFGTKRRKGMLSRV